MDDTLNAAIARLAKFRASWNKGEEVDECSHLTTDDIDLILATLGYGEDQPNPVMLEIR